MPLFEPHLQSISAGTSYATGPGISLSNAGGISFGVSGNTLTATADFIRSISAGTTVATGNQVVFANANGITFGASGQTITASVGTMTTPPTTIPLVIFTQGNFDTNYTIYNNQVSYQKMSLPMGMSGTSGVVLVDLEGNSNAWGGFTISLGVYTLTGQTAYLAGSGSGGFTWSSGSNTGVSTQFGGVSGTRYRSFGWNVSMTPGDYLMGMAGATANGGTVRVFGKQGVNIVGSFAGAETAFFLDGVYSVITAAFPSSIVATDPNYIRTGVSAAQQPGFILIGT